MIRQFAKELNKQYRSEQTGGIDWQSMLGVVAGIILVVLGLVCAYDALPF